LKTSALFAMSGFGRTSASVAICGFLGFLEASNSYKIDYIRVRIELKTFSFELGQNSSACARPFCFASGVAERSNRTLLA
jgi:hypothetical protein